MTNYYDKLLSIDLFHSFYNDGDCQDLTLAPTDECQILLRDQQLIFKSSPQGGTLLVTQKNTGTEAAPILEPRVNIAEETIFTFKLLLKNPEFLNITQLNQRDIKPFYTYILSNLPSASETSDGTTRTIETHNGALSHPQPCVGKTFRHQVKAGVNIVAVAVHNAANQKLFSIPCGVNATDISIEMHAYSEGIYQLHSIDSSGTTVETQTYFVSDDYLSTHLFAFIQIHYRADILADSEKQHAFTVNFANRSVDWKYTINVKEISPLNPDNLDVNTLSIHNPPTSFSKSVITVPPKSVTFSSDLPISLREQAYTGIQLRDGAEVLVEHLPNPVINRLTKASGSDLQSEMSLTIK